MDHRRTTSYHRTTANESSKGKGNVKKHSEKEMGAAKGVPKASRNPASRVTRHAWRKRAIYRHLESDGTNKKQLCAHHKPIKRNLC